ncbi:hypothetical protein JHW43_007289 [Diplocarpon mali]|nr:hypothetical protein JHW43_007289 [Diplocarpon mali]
MPRAPRTPSLLNPYHRHHLTPSDPVENHVLFQVTSYGVHLVSSYPTLLIARRELSAPFSTPQTAASESARAVLRSRDGTGRHGAGREGSLEILAGCCGERASGTCAQGEAGGAAPWQAPRADGEGGEGQRPRHVRARRPALLYSSLLPCQDERLSMSPPSPSTSVGDCRLRGEVLLGIGVCSTWELGIPDGGPSVIFDSSDAAGRQSPTRQGQIRIRHDAVLIDCEYYVSSQASPQASSLSTLNPLLKHLLKMQSIIALSVALFAATSAAVPKITFGNSDTRVYADAEFPLNTHRTIVDAYKSTNFNNNGKYEAHYFQLSGTDRDAHCELTIPDSTATYTRVLEAVLVNCIPPRYTDQGTAETKWLPSGVLATPFGSAPCSAAVDLLSPRACQEENIGETKEVEEEEEEEEEEEQDRRRRRPSAEAAADCPSPPRRGGVVGRAQARCGLGLPVGLQDSGAAGHVLGNGFVGAHSLLTLTGTASPRHLAAKEEQTRVTGTRGQ